jgi:hypothetical protein
MVGLNEIIWITDEVTCDMKNSYDGDKIFFGKGFEGKRVTLPILDRYWIRRSSKGTFKTTDEADYQIHRAASVAWAIYVCKGVDHPSQEEAILKIYMQ